MKKTCEEEVREWEDYVAGLGSNTSWSTILQAFRIVGAEIAWQQLVPNTGYRVFRGTVVEMNVNQGPGWANFHATVRESEERLNAGPEADFYRPLEFPELVVSGEICGEPLFPRREILFSSNEGPVRIYLPENYRETLGIFPNEV